VPGLRGAAGAVHARKLRRVKDLPHGRAPLRVWWDPRRWACRKRACRRRTFVETGRQVGVGQRLTRRLREQLEHAVSVSTCSAADVAREYGVSWWSVNHALVVKAAGLTGLAPCGVRLLGVDETRARSVRWLLAEHGWRRTDPWMTSFVDLDPTHPGGILGLAPGRSGTSVRGWLALQSSEFRDGIEVVAVDPSAPFAAAPREVLPHARLVVDHWHLHRLANLIFTQVRQRITQQVHGHRGRASNGSWEAGDWLHQLEGGVGAALLLDDGEHDQPQHDVRRPDGQLGQERTCDAAQAAATCEGAGRRDAVGHGQSGSDGVHPARQCRHGDVDSAEDQQDAEEDAGQHGDLADPQADGGAEQTEAGAGEGRDGNDQRQGGEGMQRERDLQDEGTCSQGEDRDGDAVQDHGQRAPEEQRDPPRRAHEQQAEGLGAALAADGVPHREQARDGGVLHGVADQEEAVVPDAGCPAEVGEQQHLDDWADEEGGDEDPRAEPGEQRPVAGETADEEDAQRRHVRARLAWRRALSTSRRHSRAPRIR